MPVLPSPAALWLSAAQGNLYGALVSRLPGYLGLVPGYLLPQSLTHTCGEEQLPFLRLSPALSGLLSRDPTSQSPTHPSVSRPSF